MIEYFFLILSILLINILFKKKNILPNNTGQFHQVYNQEFRVPLSGGLFIIGFFYFNYQYFELDLILDREKRTHLLSPILKFLPTRVKMDLEGWDNIDIFSHS